MQIDHHFLIIDYIIFPAYTFRDILAFNSLRSHHDLDLGYTNLELRININKLIIHTYNITHNVTNHVFCSLYQFYTCPTMISPSRQNNCPTVAILIKICLLVIYVYARCRHCCVNRFWSTSEIRHCSSSQWVY